MTFMLSWCLIDLNELCDDNYAEKTTEIIRADHSTLSTVPVCYFERLKTWEKSIHLHFTNHLLQRLKSYVNKPSQCGRYIECLPEEFKWMSEVKLEKYIFLKPKGNEYSSKVVELGWNDCGEICKVSYSFKIPSCIYKKKYIYNLLKLPDSSLKTGSGDPERWLFLCVGIDGGIKTAYITNGYKYRKSYEGKILYVNKDVITSSLTKPKLL